MASGVDDVGWDRSAPPCRQRDLAAATQTGGDGGLENTRFYTDHSQRHPQPRRVSLFCSEATLGTRSRSPYLATNGTGLWGVRSMTMRIAILHATGDEALAQQVASGIGASEAITGPISSSLQFGSHLILLVLWTWRAQDHAEDLLRLADRHGAMVVWRADGAPTPDALSHALIVGPDEPPRSIATALRLAEIRQGDAPGEPPARAPQRKGMAAVLSVGAIVVLSAAGAMAVVLDNAAPVRLAAGANVRTKAAETPVASSISATPASAETASSPALQPRMSASQSPDDVHKQPAGSTPEPVDDQPAGVSATREISSP